MKIHFVMHEAFEAPGALLVWAKQRGHHISFSKIYQNEALPSNSDDYDFLIILGGPQSPTTTKDECPHFDAKAEITLIQQAIKLDKLILGICLGAQLVGTAYGAQHEHSPHKEIGVFDIHLNEAGQQDNIFKNFPSVLPAAHWHGDMPGLTDEAQLLAYSKGCPRQIIRYAPNVYGFQCHPEFTKKVVEGLIAHDEYELKNIERNPFIQNRATLLAQDYSSMNQWLFTFLDHFTSHSNGLRLGS